ncbi:hypothetical protein [Dyadobacter luteus]|nr:hypothetical protein [Dyadobacter luteus]
MMILEALFQDKSLKAKARVSTIGESLLEQQLSIAELIAFAQNQKPTDKATCIEALEYATKKKPEIASDTLLNYVSYALASDEPRIKWESARVIGNIAKLFQGNLEIPVNNLLSNAEDASTVVRWATTFALAEILKLKTENNKPLIPAIEALCEKEEDSGVKKKYLDALKKVKK